MFWIKDTTEEFGHDLEHVEALQRKFDEFQKHMDSQEFRVSDVCETADKLTNDQHPESQVVTNEKSELLERILQMFKPSKKNIKELKEILMLLEIKCISLMRRLVNGWIHTKIMQR